MDRSAVDGHTIIRNTCRGEQCQIYSPQLSFCANQKGEGRMRAEVSIFD